MPLCKTLNDLKMKTPKHQLVTGRRNALKILGLSSAAVLSGGLNNILSGQAQQQQNLQNPPAGLPPVKIKSVKAIGTRQGGQNLVVVKVETTEPGLYGLGCATFTQRAEAVVTAINSYMPDFCVGRDADNIEDIWQSFYVNSYWRNGPVLNNALSGLDQALWDIKGKRANMPVYQLLGGKCRFAIDTYGNAGGKSPEQVADGVLGQMAEGFRYVRIHFGGYGGEGNTDNKPHFKDAGFGMPRDGYIDDQTYLRGVPKMFEAVRKRCGEEVELLHDIHERCQPRDVINMCRRLEEFRPWNIEDPLSPENTHWWKQLRESTTVPFAMGELFNNINEFL
jgi:mannonate dehydratase